MGLGGGRKRVKIGHDPNNENWARETGNYGHRMLVSQGWAPGQVLGSAENPHYSAHHLTSGSYSHVKVALREDNLGLGAKRGSGQDAGECVGLDAFQGLLGRLNGKSDEALAKEQSSRDDLKRARYVEQRGTVRFVCGGTLISDMDELIELARRSRIDMGLEDESGLRTKSERKKAKKEELRNPASPEEQEVDKSDQSSGKKRKAKKRKKGDVSSQEMQQDDVQLASSIEVTEATAPEDYEINTSAGTSEDDRARKARRKAEKAERRERKQKRREERAARKAVAAATEESDAMSADDSKHDSGAAEVQAVKVIKPTAGRPGAFGGRHAAVRSRYVAAKRRAIMDPQALKEILMVKT